MLYYKSVLMIEKEGRVYQLEKPAGAQLGEIHDVLVEMKQYIVSLINRQQETDKGVVDGSKSEISI